MTRRRDLIINRPDWQSFRQRAVLGGLTLLFWLVWFYLWLPAISLIAWAFGIRAFYVQMFEFEGFKAVLSMLATYGLVVFLMGGSLIGWAVYNWLRFRGVERRKAQAPIGVVELATGYRFSAHELESWQYCRRLIAHHDCHGCLTWVDCESDRRKEPEPNERTPPPA